MSYLDKYFHRRDRMGLNLNDGEVLDAILMRAKTGKLHRKASLQSI